MCLSYSLSANSSKTPTDLDARKLARGEIRNSANLLDQRCNNSLLANSVGPSIGIALPTSGGSGPQAEQRVGRPQETSASAAADEGAGHSNKMPQESPTSGDTHEPALNELVAPSSTAKLGPDGQLVFSSPVSHTSQVFAPTLGVDPPIPVGVDPLISFSGGRAPIAKPTAALVFSKPYLQLPAPMPCSGVGGWLSSIVRRYTYSSAIERAFLDGPSAGAIGSTFVHIDDNVPYTWVRLPSARKQSWITDRDTNVPVPTSVLTHFLTVANTAHKRPNDAYDTLLRSVGSYFSSHFVVADPARLSLVQHAVVFAVDRKSVV